MCSPEKKRLEGIQRIVNERVNQDQKSAIQLLLPKELIIYLNELYVPKSTEKAVKGYRVKLNYNVSSEEEQLNKKKSVSQIIIKAMNKMKKNNI